MAIFKNIYESKNTIIYGYRAGDIKETPRGIFFSSDIPGTIQYSETGTREWCKYELIFNKPLISKNVFELINNTHNGYLDNVDGVTSESHWMKLDEIAYDYAIENGYDSIIYTEPINKSQKEYVMFKISQIKKIEKI